MLGCVHWNFLMRISTSFLTMTCKSYIFYNDSDLHSQLKQPINCNSVHNSKENWSFPLPLLDSLDMDHSCCIWTHFNFFG